MFLLQNDSTKYIVAICIMILHDLHSPLAINPIVYTRVHHEKNKTGRRYANAKTLTSNIEKCVFWRRKKKNNSWITFHSKYFFRVLCIYFWINCFIFLFCFFLFCVSNGHNLLDWRKLCGTQLLCTSSSKHISFRLVFTFFPSKTQTNYTIPKWVNIFTVFVNNIYN